MSARGTLTWHDPATRPELLADPVRAALPGLPGVEVAEIDPELADTAAFCEAYGSALASSANCVVVAGRRGERTTFAAVMVLATMRADVNTVVRKHLDARKASFAPMEAAVELTGMEYGGITPIGLPAGWPVLVDDQVVAAGEVIIGSGIRGSKLVLPAATLLELPHAEALALATPAPSGP